jgi:hypothetical protein
MKVKSSVVLTKALQLIESNQQSFVCAAIQDVETEMRWEANENVVSKAFVIWMQFKPPIIRDDVKHLQQWWPKGDPERIATLQKAIAIAEARND